MASYHRHRLMFVIVSSPSSAPERCKPFCLTADAYLVRTFNYLLLVSTVMQVAGNLLEPRGPNTQQGLFSGCFYSSSSWDHGEVSWRYSAAFPDSQWVMVLNHQQVEVLWMSPTSGWVRLSQLGLKVRCCSSCSPSHGAKLSSDPVSRPAGPHPS